MLRSKWVIYLLTHMSSSYPPSVWDFLRLFIGKWQQLKQNFFIVISHNIIPWLIFKAFYHCGSIFSGWTSGAFATKRALNSNFGEGLVHITANWITSPIPLGTPPHLNIRQQYLCLIQRPSLSGWDDAYSIEPVLKTQNSHTLNCFHPALIKDVFKREKKLLYVDVFSVETRLCLHFTKMVEITSKSPF